MESEFYTPDEVAERLKITANTVRRWCRTGVLPSIKVGLSRRIKKEDLDKVEKEGISTVRNSPHFTPEKKESQPVKEDVTPNLPIEEDWPILRYDDANVREATSQQYSERLARQLQFLNNPTIPD